MELRSNVTGTALVCEGGGMRASYTAGLITTLLENGLYLDHVSGISAGSSHLCNYLSRDLARTKASFVDFAADPHFGSWRTFARGQGLFNAQYIYEESSGPDQALPFDWDTWAANPATPRVGGFCADTGEHVYWTRADFPDLPALLARVRASSTMPVVMPPVQIDGTTWVDGALGPSGGIPLDAAQADGQERVLVVLTRERGFVKQPVRTPHLLKAWFRRFPAVAEALAGRHVRYNQTREEVFDLERDGKAYVFAPEHMPVSNSTRDVARLAESYQQGLAQARAELPRIREFLGLAG